MGFFTEPSPSWFSLTRYISLDAKHAGCPPLSDLGKRSYLVESKNQILRLINSFGITKINNYDEQDITFLKKLEKDMLKQIMICRNNFFSLSRNM